MIDHDNLIDRYFIILWINDGLWYTMTARIYKSIMWVKQCHKTSINHPLYHLFMVIWEMVYGIVRLPWLGSRMRWVKLLPWTTCPRFRKPWSEQSWGTDGDGLRHRELAMTVGNLWKTETQRKFDLFCPGSSRTEYGIQCPRWTTSKLWAFS
jgi:hypothetical protein